MPMLVVYGVSLTVIIIQLRVRVTIIGYKKVNNTNCQLSLQYNIIKSD